VSNPENPHIPAHIGIIPDGNRRWAKQHGKLALIGHQQGADIMEDVCQRAFDLGVQYVTAYAFSAENWNRPPDEIGYLMKLFEKTIGKSLKKLEDRGIRIRMIGQRDGLPAGLLKAVEGAETRTAGYTNGTFSVCLNYGGLQELVDATAELAKGGEAVTPESLMRHLYAPDIPPVDLIIRTSGEHRTSGFMLARASYAELYFVDKYWPDFTPDDIEAAIDNYTQRQRRFGA
jgi:undecaprenyl diphosphate synthase